MSLVTLLSIARTALITQQRAMDVTANNVANAQTPGYSRQRLVLTEADPQWTAFGAVGRGVTVEDLARARDGFHDTSFRQESGMLGRSSTLADLFGQVEAALNEPSDTGITAALDGFFHGFADLANSPSSSAARQQARQGAQQLVDRLHQLDSEIGRAATTASAQIQTQVTQINAIAHRIADLNTKVLSMGGSGHDAPDLQDQRDALVDQLSGMVGVRVTEAQDGTLSVSTGGAVLVDHGTVQELATQTAGATTSLVIAGSTIAVDPQAGSLKGLLEMVNTDLPGLRGQLDTFAATLVAQVNAIHGTGTTASGATNTPFFEPGGVTAGTIQIRAAVLASIDAIATGTTGAAGDGSVAARIAALGDQSLAGLGNRTLGGWLADFASAVGTSSSQAQQDVTTYQTLADRSDTLRQSVSGVNIDEEMVAMITEQQAYGAASRIVKMADDMMQTLLQMI